MDRLLTLALASWSGRSATQAALESRGLLVPGAWQRSIMYSCQEEVDELVRYWDEYAREIVCSAGRCNPDTRSFVAADTYRSDYLDELARKRDFGELPLKNPPLVRSLYEYKRRILM